tara:strand:+ start:629 stop:1030 length:402 start_codon:yes stop_codon:yes gene_type:complete
MAGINSADIAYHFGQMGSGHIRTNTSSIKPPHGRVIIAITMLDSVTFSTLTADASGASTLVDQSDPDTRGDGVAFFGSQTQTRANGLDSSSAVESEAVANTVVFPKGLTIYGRWTEVSLQNTSANGIIVYYGA